MALPFLNVIDEVVHKSHPTVIADLGGGTGFILGELLRRSNLDGIKLLNIDISSRQLSACCNSRIETVQESASRITRRQLQAEDGVLLLVARSLLHYFGQIGAKSLLSHIRSQQVEGEFFVHQSACFQSDSEAGCLNLIYRLMGTDKWYGTIGELKEMLEATGWEVCYWSPAPKLHLSSWDLSERYGLHPQLISSIRTAVHRHYGQRSDIFILNQDGFDAWMNYFIFVCRAI